MHFTRANEAPVVLRERNEKRVRNAAYKDSSARTGSNQQREKPSGGKNSTSHNRKPKGARFKNATLNNAPGSNPRSGKPKGTRVNSTQSSGAKSTHPKGSKGKNTHLNGERGAGAKARNTRSNHTGAKGTRSNYAASSHSAQRSAKPQRKR